MMTLTADEGRESVGSQLQWLDDLEQILGVMLYDIQELIGDDDLFFEFVTGMRNRGLQPARAAAEIVRWLTKSLPTQNAERQQAGADSVSNLSPARQLSASLSSLCWPRLGRQLTDDGYALIPRLLDAETCERLRSLFDDQLRFAKTVDMAEHEYGKGVYKYFKPPLPDVVDSLRRNVYPYAARIANSWQRLLGEAPIFPSHWDEYREVCRAAGQTWSTPILLHYPRGGYQILHRDIRGDVFFPLQLLVVLSRRFDPADPKPAGFRGGDFLFCDVPPRNGIRKVPFHARRRVLQAGLGDAVLFATRDRLVQSAAGYRRQPVEHGVTRVDSDRMSLGVPFHDYR